MKLAFQMFAAFILFQVIVSLVVAKSATEVLQQTLGQASTQISAALTR